MEKLEATTLSRTPQPQFMHRMGVVALLLGLEAVLLLPAVGACALGATCGADLYVGTDHYRLVGSQFLILFGILGSLDAVALGATLSQRYYPIVLIATIVGTTLGLALLIDTGQVGWLATRGLLLALVISARSSFVEKWRGPIPRRRFRWIVVIALLLGLMGLSFLMAMLLSASMR
jgi:hypothetical protein